MNVKRLLNLMIGFGLLVTAAQTKSRLLLLQNAVADEPISAEESESKSHGSPKNADGTWKFTNRLVDESSPYLLQHAHNPVDWYPWGPEAFEAARKSGKPIFLSIGYSTCYWCHVMERQCFENEVIAKQMNEVCVCIKVDREERPDVDDVYMTVTQMMTGSGGWPMNLMLTPPGSSNADEKGLKPFWAGTYLPPEPMQGRGSLPQLLTGIEKAWRTDRPRIANIANKVAEAVIKNSESRPPEGRLDKRLITDAVETLMSRYDKTNGGFGDAPKFPTPNNTQLLIRLSERDTSSAVWKAVQNTLNKMAHGGLFDQVGGGFHRYSVDAKWLVPHFEKMLYDNGQLVETYLAANAIEPPADDPDRYRRVVRETCDYVLREMTDPNGAFWSAQDAEVNGHEGENYLWTSTGIETSIGDERMAELAKEMYGLKLGTNFQDPHHPGAKPANVLYLPQPLATISQTAGGELEALLKERQQINKRLLVERNKRDQPRLDDKVLTSWNGMMIAGMARAGRDLNEPRYSTAARQAVDCILQNMRADDGTLLHTMRNGKAKIPGYLEDYAFLVHGLCELFRTSHQRKDLIAAESLMQIAQKTFANVDDKVGGYYDTQADQNDLFVRTRNTYDGARPCPNSQMVHNLLDLHELTNKQAYLDRAVLNLKAFAGNMQQSGVGMAHMLHALDRAIEIAPEKFE